MIDDLRHIPKQEDSFQIVPPDACVLLLCWLVLMAWMLRDVLRWL